MWRTRAGRGTPPAGLPCPGPDLRRRAAGGGAGRLADHPADRAARARRVSVGATDSQVIRGGPTGCSPPPGCPATGSDRQPTGHRRVDRGAARRPRSTRSSVRGLPPAGWPRSPPTGHPAARPDPGGAGHPGAYPVYDVGTVPAATYGIPAPITTLFVRKLPAGRRRAAGDLAGALGGRHVASGPAGPGEPGRAGVRPPGPPSAPSRCRAPRRGSASTARPRSTTDPYCVASYATLRAWPGEYDSVESAERRTR